MKMTGEDVGWRVKWPLLICFVAVLSATAPARAQSLVGTNWPDLIQQSYSAENSIYLPWGSFPGQWRAFSFYGTEPVWVSSDMLQACTNFSVTNLQVRGVAATPIALTEFVLTGEVLVQSPGATGIIVSVAAPSGYVANANPRRGVFWEWSQATNCADCWGLTASEIPPPTVTFNPLLIADLADYSIYASNMEAEAEAAAAAQASSAPTLAMGGGFMAMDDDDMDGGDPCVITNYSIPFSVVSIAPDGGGDIILRWQSCTDAVYIVQSESSLTPTSSWADVAWMFGTDQETSWTDTNAVGLTQNFYQVVRANPNTLNNGIPYGWAVTYGLDPLDPNLASEDPTGDGIDNLQKYEYGLSPTVSNVVDVVVDGGSVWATNQTITLDASGFPFPFLEVSLQPTMTNAVLLANNGVPLTYALPSASNATYYLFLQYTDASTNALGPVLFKPVTLDTIPPWVDITSPTNGTASDAFVHLQATVFDPDPQNPTAPGVFRPVKIWINGQRYWNLSNHQIDIPRYPVAAYSNNLITIVAQDQAGNTTQAGVSIYINPTNTAPPTLTLTGFAPNTVTDLPDESNVWVSGQMDDLNAIVTASVNGGDPISMNVRSNQFGYLLPVDWGTNTVVIMGANAAGYVSSNVLTLVCGNRYQFAFTTPVPGTYINNSNVQVSGYVSAFRDAGLPTQTNVLSVTVNGVPTHLTDGGGGLTNFTTIAPLPVPTDGSALVLNAVVTWADGSTDPSAEDEGYFITAKQSTSNQQVDWTWNCGSSSGYSWSYVTGTYTFSDPGANNNTVSITRDYGGAVDWNCDGQSSSGENDETNVYTSWWPGSGMAFGCLAHGQSWYDSPGAWNESYLETYYGDEEMTVIPPWNYAPGTWVELTFWDLGYQTDGGPMDLSAVTYQGQAPIPGQPGSYLVQMSGDTPFTISAGSFGWPSVYDSGNNAPYFYWTDSYDNLSFSDFSNQQLLPEIDISGMTHSAAQSTGAVVVCNCNSNSPIRRQVTIQSPGVAGVNVVLTIPGDLKVFTAATGGAQITSGASFPSANLPANLWVEGAQASGSLMDSKLSVQINGSGPSDYATFTVLWANLTVKISGTLDPNDNAAFLSDGNWPTDYGGWDFGGGNGLGPIDCLSTPSLNFGYTVGKIEAKATLQPTGIGNLVPTGWDMGRTRLLIAWDNGVLTASNPSPGVYDAKNPDTKYLTPTTGAIFSLDAPSSPILGGTNINHTTEVYDNFYQYVTVALGGTVQTCSVVQTWSYTARVDADNPSNKVQSNQLSTTPISLPTSPFYAPR